MNDQLLIPPHGGYRQLKSFQVAQLVYDLTVRFCKRYVSPRSRTYDQMVQAARSGVQNIAEGSEVSATSRKMEMKLTQVARASLEELRLDYEDFLRQRRLPIWKGDDPRRAALVARRCRTVEEIAKWIQEVHDRGRCGLSGQEGRQGRSTASTPSTSSPYSEIAANAALTLINVAGALLNRQVAAQAAAFLRQGGFTERLHQARRRNRNGL
jgi:four helix bundle suffix protein